MQGKGEVRKNLQYTKRLKERNTCMSISIRNYYYLLGFSQISGVDIPPPPQKKADSGNVNWHH